jgi:Stress responsive A/B Barrel Domain
VAAGPAFDDQRNQGYTVAVISVFKSVEDMKYYDDECEAHAALKQVAKSVHKGAMMVYFQSVLSSP